MSTGRPAAGSVFEARGGTLGAKAHEARVSEARVSEARVSEARVSEARVSEAEAE